MDCSISSTLSWTHHTKQSDHPARFEIAPRKEKPGCCQSILSVAPAQSNQFGSAFLLFNLVLVNPARLLRLSDDDSLLSDRSILAVGGPPYSTVQCSRCTRPR